MPLVEPLSPDANPEIVEMLGVISLFGFFGLLE